MAGISAGLPLGQRLLWCLVCPEGSCQPESPRMCTLTPPSLGLPWGTSCSRSSLSASHSWKM